MDRRYYGARKYTARSLSGERAGSLPALPSSYQHGGAARKVTEPPQWWGSANSLARPAVCSLNDLLHHLQTDPLDILIIDIRPRGAVVIIRESWNPGVGIPQLSADSADLAALYPKMAQALERVLRESSHDPISPCWKRLESGKLLLVDDDGLPNGPAFQISAHLQLGYARRFKDILWLESGVQGVQRTWPLLCVNRTFSPSSMSIKAALKPMSEEQQMRYHLLGDGNGESLYADPSVLESVTRRIHLYSLLSTPHRKPELHRPDEIIPSFLYLGPQESAHPDHLRSLGIANVVRIGFNYPSAPPHVRCHDFQLDDLPQARIDKVWSSTNEILEHIRIKKERVLVHCQAGVSRSVAVVLAYLMRCQKRRLREAYEQVYRARPIASPNPGFWNFLENYEKVLFGLPKTTLPLFWMYNFHRYLDMKYRASRCTSIPEIQSSS